MRTTITLEDDAFAVAQAYAQARSLRLGQAVSELIRRANAGPLPLKQKNGIWMFDLPADTPPVSSRRVSELLKDFP